ncbi:MAG TPA: DUF4185 domain-containing protein [Chthonomonadaceae bacterium]|nr:DUF4185 domain-containing protein [Chthonomonadaceae bacterium]
MRSIPSFVIWFLSGSLMLMGGPGRLHAPAEPPAPASGPRVLRVENRGLLFTDNQAGVSGVDGGYSLPLGAQTLWLFGDTFLLHPTAPERPYVGGVSNCALLVPRGRGTEPLRRYAFLTDAKTGLARPVIPNAAGEGTETRLWPAGGWYDAAHRRAYLYYSINRTTGGGPFDFRVEGMGLACADVSRPAALQFTRLKTRRGSTLWWPGGGTDPIFGAAVITDAPGDMLYIVGVQERGGRKFGKMARVRKERLADLDAYEYFAGSPTAPRWSKRLAEAADVEGLTAFPNELSVAYNPYLGGYLAVHSVLISQRARLSLASQPWGPYRPIAEIGTPHLAYADAFCYAGKEHPELAEQKGKVLYITYVDSRRYWLSLLKVTLGPPP